MPILQVRTVEAQSKGLTPAPDPVPSPRWWPEQWRAGSERQAIAEGTRKGAGGWGPLLLTPRPLPGLVTRG